MRCSFSDHQDILNYQRQQMTRFTSMPIILKRQQSCLAIAPRVARSIVTDHNCLENNILSYEDLQPEWGEDHDDRSSNDTAPSRAECIGTYIVLSGPKPHKCNHHL